MKEKTKGLISTTTEFVLFAIFYGFEIALGGKRSLTFSGTQSAADRANKVLGDLNQRKIKRTIFYLQEKGFIKFKGKHQRLLEITKAGIQRLRNRIPTYQKNRPWDGYLYLISYDVAIEKNYHRNILRYFLKKLGCGMLQQSLWITPYNPTPIIKKFTKERGLHGMILVSRLGRDGNVGGLSTQELVNKVYRIEELEARYQKYIKKYKDRPLSVPKWQAAFDFLLILRDDPQLPWELLPKKWVGDKAYRVFHQLLR